MEKQEWNYIEQDISSNGNKQVLYWLKLGIALSLKIWDKIRHLLLEDLIFYRKLGFEI